MLRRQEGSHPPHVKGSQERSKCSMQPSTGFIDRYRGGFNVMSNTIWEGFGGTMVFGVEHGCRLHFHEWHITCPGRPSFRLASYVSRGRRVARNGGQFSIARTATLPCLFYEFFNQPGLYYAWSTAISETHHHLFMSYGYNHNC